MLGVLLVLEVEGEGFWVGGEIRRGGRNNDLTAGGLRRWGFREDGPITLYKPCQRELRLKIALKLPWRITACYAKLFFSR